MVIHHGVLINDLVFVKIDRLLQFDSLGGQKLGVGDYAAEIQKTATLNDLSSLRRPTD